MPRVTAEDLEKYQSLQAKAAELSREARTLRDEADRIYQAASEDLEKTGKPQAKRGGFLLRWIEKPATVRWKQALVDALGVDKAAEIQKEAGTTRRLVITPPN